MVWLREEASKNPVSDEEAEKIAEAVAERVKLGDIKNVIVKRDDEVLFTLPVGQSIAAGVGGILLAPYAVIPGAIIAFGQNVKVELETNDGDILDIKGNKI